MLFLMFGDVVNTSNNDRLSRPRPTYTAIVVVFP